MSVQVLDYPESNKAFPTVWESSSLVNFTKMMFWMLSMLYIALCHNAIL